MGEHATTTMANEKTDKANASTSVLKQKYQALLESRNKVRRMRLNARGAVFSRTRCVSTRRVDAYGVLTSKKSRIARHDSTKKKPKNCAGR